MARRTRILTGGLLALALWGTGLPGASADAVVQVRAGESIQQAVDHAAPGSTVRLAAGTYRQHVLITKTLRLVGQGRVVLRAPSFVTPNQCTEQIASETGLPADVGLCVQGDLGERDLNGELTVLAAVQDVQVDNIEVVGFTEGVLAYGTAGLRLQRIRTSGNSDTGLFTGMGHDTVLQDITAQDNGTSGIRVDLSQDVQLLASTSRGNGWGVGINEVTRGVVADNRLSDNCVGLLAFDTSEPAPTGLLDIRGNQVQDNSRFCPADGGPALGGLGIALIGTTRVHVHDNTISRNRAHGEPDLGGAGVLLLDATDLTGGSVPIGNVIDSNRLQGNSPAQVVFDGSGVGNEIRDNHCTPRCA